MNLTLKTKLVLLNSLVTCALITALGFAVQRFSTVQLLQKVDAELTQKGRDLDGLLCLDGSKATNDAVASQDLFCVDSTFTRARVFDQNGKSLTEQTRDVPLTDQIGLTTIQLEGNEYRVFSQQIAGKTIQHIYPLKDFNLALSAINQTLLMLMPLGLLLSVAGSAFLTGRSLKPMGDIARKAEEITADNFQARLPAESAELGRLSQTLNNMLDRLQTSHNSQAELIDRQKRFISDASHELRTPLTIIKGATELALEGRRENQELRKALRRIDSATDTLVGLNEDLLTLARNSSQSVQVQEPLEIRALLEEAVEPFAGEVRFEGTGSAYVLASSGALKRVVWNLINNAMVHSERASLVEVRLSIGDSVLIDVSDRGKGISPEALPHVFDRFYTGDQARQGGGMGLGLAICKEIVERHNGTISIESSPGSGTTVRVELPKLEIEERKLSEERLA